MNSHYTYFLILLASIAGPLALSFDKKVAFYKKWRYVFPAMLLPALFYIIWDEWFTRMGIWQFNPAYITGIKLGSLPVEEVLFFFVVPYCCLFIYECIRCYFPALKDHALSERIFIFLGAGLLVFGLLNHARHYTFYTFIFNAIFILLFFLLRKYFRHFHLTAFLIAYLIILVPFLLVNGFLTAIPVVLYNDAENLGLRIYTIPFEDVFYGMLLVMMNVAGFEWLRRRGKNLAG